VRPNHDAEPLEVRRTVLPLELVRKYENDSFWRDPARNPNEVRVV
jgi:sulfotransferase